MDAEEPPFVIDGARVVRYAIVDASGPGARRSGIAGDGVPVDFGSASRMLMAEDLLDGSIVLMHCNAEWMTVVAQRHPDLESAQRSADAACAGLAVEWRPFRSLTAEERRELETTRSFLRELAREYGDG